MTERRSWPDNTKEQHRDLRNKNFDLLKSYLTVLSLIFICRKNLVCSKRQHPLHNWLIHFFVPTGVRVHWNKYLPSLHPLYCLSLLGLSWWMEIGSIPFISQPDWEVTAAFSWYAASEVEIKHMHTHTMEIMQIRRKDDYILLI